MSYVIYCGLCILNGVLIMNLTDLSINNWETWLWFVVPLLSYICGSESARKE